MRAADLGETVHWHLSRVGMFLHLSLFACACQSELVQGPAQQGCQTRRTSCGGRSVRNPAARPDPLGAAYKSYRCVYCCCRDQVGTLTMSRCSSPRQSVHLLMMVGRGARVWLPVPRRAWLTCSAVPGDRKTVIGAGAADSRRGQAPERSREMGVMPNRLLSRHSGGSGSRPILRSGHGTVPSVGRVPREGRQKWPGETRQHPGKSHGRISAVSARERSVHIRQNVVESRELQAERPVHPPWKLWRLK